ncbi:g3061 [Coccomyxa viridis]|uniref:G3061 protein n=1 Tax=Coccomyxa viridis TaxID=1274662 RepID=A0ABP1FPW1_9CHLO
MISKGVYLRGSGARKLSKAFQIRQQRPARAAASHTTTVCRQVQKVTAEELEVAIQTRDRPLVIDFYATWCGPCLLLAKELEQVYDELGDDIRIIKIDTDENPDLSSQLQIQGLPTMVFVGVDPNKPALRTEGLLPAASIKEIIQTELLPQAQAAE